MAGDLHPGQKLVEADLCQELNVSRASLREALRALEAERLIELVPNRGPSVAKLGEKEIEDIHEVWALLTGDAVFHFTQLADDKDIEKLEAVVARRALRGANPIEQLDVTNAFFSYMTTRCGNQVLRGVVHSLVSQLNFLRAQALCQDGWRDLCAHEINDILSAIRAKKPVAARQATKRHIESACRAATAVALMPRRGASEPNNNGNISRLVQSPRASASRSTKSSRSSTTT